ncbi:MAG: hypothetical protein UZ08_BCD001001760 [Candidatus Parvibacillus calidus]|jgi:hypothetical protein|nr:MAG: hypothetical protein UZ08_BCD001001760 [Candidatus Parvibacillus calidus]
MNPFLETKILISFKRVDNPDPITFQFREMRRLKIHYKWIKDLTIRQILIRIMGVGKKQLIHVF